MCRIKIWVAVGGLAGTLLMQSCSFAPKAPDELARKQALVRWNHCLERFQSDVQHYCDGHRRDVLATYPAHLENQVNLLLVQQTRTKQVPALLKTGLHPAADESYR